MTPLEKHFTSLSAKSPVTGCNNVIDGSRRYEAVSKANNMHIYDIDKSIDRWLIDWLLENTKTYENLILDNKNGKEIAYKRKNIVTYVLVG